MDSFSANYARLGFKVRRRDTDDVCFELIYNAFFGIQFMNHLSNDEDPQHVYLDIDLDLSRVTDKMFLIIHDQRLYITAGGLSFIDIIFASDFIAGRSDEFYLDFETKYIFPASV